MKQDLKIEFDATINYLQQVFPGQYLPDLPDLKKYPDPNNVCRYVSKEKFKKLPKWQSQWVHWDNQSKLILEGKYFELKPIHFEGIFTLVCNLMCPHCTRQNDRYSRVEDNTWNINSKANSKNTLLKEQLFKVIDEIYSVKDADPLGIVWGGGDPTCNPYTYDAMLYAKDKGINSSFITNGVLIDVNRLVEIEPILVRISLNCGSKKIYNDFHGLPVGSDSFYKVISKIKEFGIRKLSKGLRTLLGISLIIDERNFNDTIIACKTLADINKNYDGKLIDYVIIRPVMQYDFFESNVAMLKHNTKKNSLELINKKLSQILLKGNIPLIPIKDSFFNPPGNDFYKGGSKCLAFGLFSEIRYNGDIQICSDSYGNPEYTIGNLLENNISEIWNSDRRREVLNKINKKECYKYNCPYNSRGHHHNRILHEVEKHRRDGKIDEVKKWVKDLNQVTYPLGHSFFI